MATQAAGKNMKTTGGDYSRGGVGLNMPDAPTIASQYSARRSSSSIASSYFK